MACDPERIWEKLDQEFGACEQYYELWLPRMMPYRVIFQGTM
jgi:hypothetical protein